MFVLLLSNLSFGAQEGNSKAIHAGWYFGSTLSELRVAEGCMTVQEVDIYEHLLDKRLFHNLVLVHQNERQSGLAGDQVFQWSIRKTITNPLGS